MNPLQEGAEIAITDEINLCFQRMFQDEEEPMATATKPKASKAKPPKFNPDSPSARLQQKFTTLPGPPVESQAATKMQIVEEKDLPLSALRPSPENPREDWDKEFLQQLGESLRDNGQLTPLTVRVPDVDGVHEIIDGETRYRAAKLIGLKSLRVSVIECTDAEAAMARVLSYRQRRDLNPIEEARGLKLLLDKYGCSQRELEAKVGISQGQISNRVRLLDLPKAWQARVISGEITATGARELAAWTGFPEVFSVMDKEWKNDWRREQIIDNPGQYARHTARGDCSLELDGREYVNGQYLNWKIEVAKLPEETRTALKLREIPGEGKTKETRAFNRELARQLKAEAIEKAKQAAKKKADKADAADRKPLTAAEQKARAEKQEAIYAKKLWRYYVAWHRSQLLALFDDIENAPPVEQVALWLIYQGGRHIYWSIDRAEEFAEALGFTEGAGSDEILNEAAAAETSSDRWEETIYETAKRWLAHDFEKSGTDLAPKAVVAFAIAGGVKLAEAWRLDEEFLQLHNSGQLNELAKEWKIELPKGLKRSGLIAEILSCSEVRDQEGKPPTAPKCLLKPQAVSLH